MRVLRYLVGIRPVLPTNRYHLATRLIGYAVIVMVPVVVLVGNWIATTMDPNRCPIGLVCQN